MTVKPLEFKLLDLEESFKHTVTAHAEVADGTWRNLHQRLDNATTLSVYCDCSVIAGRFHLGVCIAGLHTCRLFASTLKTEFPQYTVLGEIHALEFAIQCVQDFMSTSERDAIKSITVFSDADHILRLLNSNTQRMHPPVSGAVRLLNRHIGQFSAIYPSVRVHKTFPGNTAQR